MKPTYQDIKAAAQYRWQEIHAAIGIDPRYLKNKLKCGYFLTNIKLFFV